jgi:hypothetical protein
LFFFFQIKISKNVTIIARIKNASHGDHSNGTLKTFCNVLNIIIQHKKSGRITAIVRQIRLSSAFFIKKQRINKITEIITEGIIKKFNNTIVNPAISTPQNHSLSYQ